LPGHSGSRSDFSAHFISRSRYVSFSERAIIMRVLYTDFEQRHKRTEYTIKSIKNYIFTAFSSIRPDLDLQWYGSGSDVSGHYESGSGKKFRIRVDTDLQHFSRHKRPFSACWQIASPPKKRPADQKTFFLGDHLK